MSQKIYSNLEIKGNVTISNITNATSDTDKFLVSDGGLLKYRTGNEMLFDIGVTSGYVPYTGAISNLNLGEYQLSTGQITFDQTPTQTAGVGVLRWNDADGTLDLGLKGGNVTLQLGQEQLVRVVNKTLSNLTEAGYQAVYTSGAQGQRLKVDLALANSDLTSAGTLGIVTENIAVNQEGFVTTNGLVRGINTTGSLQSETWIDGDILYLSPTTAGRITNIKPIAPFHTVVIGVCVHAHATQGSLFVKVDNGYELEELHNVLITGVSNNDILVYESATTLWKNKSISTILGYTPANDANVVHLTGNETVNGTKTFPSSPLFNLGARYKTATLGYQSINAFDTGWAFGTGSTTNQLNFNGTTGYNYTFPNANGTLALTSNLSAYQPLLSGTGFVKSTAGVISYDTSTYLTTISGIAAGGELSGTYPNPTLLNSAVTGKVLTGVNITGGSVSATDSILTAFGKLQNQVNGLVGGTIYQSIWNASTNSPTLTSSVGTKGYYYIVSVAGSTNLNGITDWKVGDWAIYDGASWQKVDNTDAVSSVNGFTGAVSLTTSNISEVTNLYYTDARSRSAISLTTTGNSGASTYSSATGIFNIPTYTLAGLGGQPLDADLTAISALVGNSGFLKKTAADTWALDTNAYTTNLGTVTSVGGTGTVSGLSLSGTVTTSGNITLSGTLAVTASNFASQTANTVLAAPDTTNGVPTFRPLTLADLPDAWVKKSVGCATTVALTLNTAQTTIDGVTLTATTRVLIKDQATPAQNGIYTGVTTTTWVRTADASISSELAGASVAVDAGTVNGGLSFDCDFKSTDTLGTTAMTWSRILDRGYLTTVGNSFSTLTNPSAITFPRINADNTVSALNAATFRTAIGAGTSSTTGTVTSVSALTLGTAGTDLSSTVATGTTTPVITLNVPTASATNRGVLSSTDWSTFNNKQNALTLTTTGTSGAATLVGNTLNIPQYSGGGGVTGSSTIGYASFWTSTTGIGGSSSFFWDNTNKYLGIGTNAPQTQLHIKSAASVGIMRLQGLGDADNYSVLEMWDDTGASKWQFAHKLYAGQTKDFSFTHWNGTSWIAPILFKDNGRILINKITGDDGVNQLQVNGSIAATSYTGGATLTGTPTAPTAAPGTNTEQIATTAFVQQAIRPYKVYTALLTQVGTNAPTAIILENTIGAIVWSRSSTGIYIGTLSGAFTTDKTSVLITNGSANSAYIHGAQVLTSRVNVITPADGQIDKATIEIRVYN